jgi:alpha-amylase
MCNNASRWDMSQLDHAGLAGISPANAVTFVDNPDTDLSSPAISNKMLAYAYILTSEGYPCVFYKDYSTDQGCYGLKPKIDNLAWIHENLAFGTTVCRFKDFQAIIYERQGYPNLLVGLNNDSQDGWRTLAVQTGFGPNTQLHDYTGHAGDVWTDAGGRVTIDIPPNNNGLGYVAYSRTGFGRPFAAVPHRVTQTFEGASDLDIGPAVEGKTVQVGRIWCAAGSQIDAVFVPNAANWAAGTQLQLEILDPRGAPVASQPWTAGQPAPGPLRVAVGPEGWYTAQVKATGLAEPAGVPFELALSYTCTQTLRRP